MHKSLLQQLARLLAHKTDKRLLLVHTFIFWQLPSLYNCRPAFQGRRLTYGPV